MIRNLPKPLILLLICTLVCCHTGVAQYDTLWAPEAAPTPLIKWRHPYHQTLTLKLFLSQAGFDEPYKRKDNGKSTVYLTIDGAFKVIKKLDRLTSGIPKIIYLVGWQYNGHDSKYPAFFEGNENLKRPQDKNALESIRWLMREAKNYHTTVSLHINMFDAYEDSPLWNEYVKHDIIAKKADGTLLAGEWGYPISYAQEWKTGFAQKRIDSLCKLLPVGEAGTIHIDAFHTWPPMPSTDTNGNAYVDLKKKITSPYLQFNEQDETTAQQKIFEYWASKGIDVTSEGVDFLRDTDFAGLQPMAWWFTRSAEDYLRYPAGFYTGGVDNGEWGKLFGSSIHGEREIKNDPVNLSGILENFCLHTVPWYYLNRFKRLYIVRSDNITKAVFSNNIESAISGKQYSLKQDGKLLSDGEDILIPALWMPETAMIAYSKHGYENREWRLPENFSGYKKLDVYRITAEGRRFLYSIPARNGMIRLSVPAATGYIILPGKKSTF
ncbi:MAG: hypothetical protein KF862_06660 [Chitinophagaceae bacterium]|nr:hypothetical protein [Chitinophagaceae bacterium]